MNVEKIVRRLALIIEGQNRAIRYYMENSERDWQEIIEAKVLIKFCADMIDWIETEGHTKTVNKQQPLNKP